MNLRAASLRVCLSVGALCALTGCQTVADNGRYAVTAMKAPFYKYGPAQAFGADFALVRGQHVTMVERGFGFSRVLTEDGVSGFISTEDLASKPEPPPPAPARVASRNTGGSNAGPRRKPAARPEPDAGLFNFNANDVPLPTEPELPKKDEIQPPKPDAKPATSSETKTEPKPSATPAPKAGKKKRAS